MENEEHVMFASAIKSLSEKIDQLENAGLSFEDIIVIVRERIPAKQRPSKKIVRETLLALRSFANQLSET